MLDRAINGLDIATGETEVGSDYKTVSLPTSTYRVGDTTVQYKNIPSDTIYNTTTNEP